VCFYNVGIKGDILTNYGNAFISHLIKLGKAYDINNDLVIHRQVKTNDIISRHFGDLMTPLSRVQMRIKLTNASSRVITNLHSGGGYTNTLARIESICTFKLGVNCLM